MEDRDYCKKCGHFVTTLLTHDCSQRNNCPSCTALRAEVERLNKLVVGLDWRSGEIKELQSQLALAEKVVEAAWDSIKVEGEYVRSGGVASIKLPAYYKGGPLLVALNALRAFDAALDAVGRKK